MMKRAFTLIELLVVIAIIAILAGITFPVFARVRDSGYRSGDLTAMNNLRTALQLYKADQGGYPPQILGYASLYYGGPNDGQVVPADQSRSYLYGSKIKSIEALRPAYDRVVKDKITGAYWPNQDDRPIGAAPVLDLNGDGKIDSADDTASARQKFGPSQKVQRTLRYSDYVASRTVFGVDENVNAATVTPGTDLTLDAEFYEISGFDVATVKIPGGTRTELRYAPFWTTYGLGAGNASDDPRQLGYSEPPENTVVTWNSFFRDYDQNIEPAKTKGDQVLFLSGGAKPIDSSTMSRYSWRVTP